MKDDKMTLYTSKDDDDVQIQSMGKLFRVRAIGDEAGVNHYCERNEDCGVIASFGENLWIVANLYEGKRNKRR